MKTRSLLGLGLCLFVLVSVADAQRLESIPVASKKVPRVQARFGSADSGGGLAGSCEIQLSSHTDASFEGGVYIAQGGFAEQEIAAVSYTLSASDFPIKIELIEKIFFTSQATVPTETEWSLLVWEGTPREGDLKFVFSSDGIILPHISLPPGTSGVNVQVSVDPSDPDQIILNDNGTQTFSIGFRIDSHNSQTANPCITVPPTCCNAFPTTDSRGLDEPTQNWIFALDCGIFGCTAGWSRFSEFGFCTPSGDWVMRAHWTQVNCNVVGACCLSTGSCVDGVPEAECVGIGGTWGGTDSLCGDGSCETPSEDVPCCFAATGGCVPLPLEDCLNVDGVPGPEGVLCAEHVCFPEGAVCMPNGSCIDGLGPDDAETMGGIFMGDGTTCATTSCPQPTGACCFENGTCLEMTASNCELTGATWSGMDTTCDDLDEDGVSDDCVVDLVGDVNGDGRVDGADLTLVLGSWGTNDPDADVNDDGIVDGADLTIVLGGWTG